LRIFCPFSGGALYQFLIDWFNLSGIGMGRRVAPKGPRPRGNSRGNSALLYYLENAGIMNLTLYGIEHTPSARCLKMGMNENLPIHVEEPRDVGNITYANEVIAIIAGMAANEVEGVAGTSNTGSIADLFGRPKPVTRGVKVEVGTEEASVDVMLTVEYGKPIQKVCVEVQESVRKAIETMTGLKVLKVDVHVMAVSFEKETQEMAQGYVKATQADAEPEEARGRGPAKRVRAERAGSMDDGFDPGAADTAQAAADKAEMVWDETEEG